MSTASTTPHHPYPAGMVGTVLGICLACLMNLAEVPSTVRPQGQAWAVFYLPFLIALCYFVVMEQELETELYEPFTRGLSKRKCVIEYILRALCALFFGVVIGLPFGIVPDQYRINQSGVNGTINELEFRLCLLIFSHLLLQIWDLLVLWMQDGSAVPDSLIPFATIFGDLFGTVILLITVMNCGALADANVSSTSLQVTNGLTVFIVLVCLLLAYFYAMTRVIRALVRVLAWIARDLLSMDWPETTFVGGKGPILSLKQMRWFTSISVVLSTVMLIGAVLLSFR